MELTERFAWRGREVAWSRFGEGDPVVFCHGTPWSSVLWKRLATELSRDFTVHLWDMPGYGHSSMDPGHAVDLGIQGELFSDLLAHWGLDEPRAAPHVVAHDFGGAVALRTLLLRGARFASLCLVDVVALRPWGSDFFRLVRDHADVFTALPPVVHAGALEAYIRTASHRGLSAQELAGLTAPWLTTQGQDAFYQQIAQADERFTEEFLPHLAGIDIPVRVVWGEQDTWLPVAQATRLTEAIPGATLRTVAGAGHLIQYDAPDALGEELRTWLTGQARG